MDAKNRVADLDLDINYRPAAPWAPAPGKRSMTQGLAPRPIVYRVESVAAAHAHAYGPRDDNGVAAGADAAIDRAAASSGEPLRPDLRARFEGSLGADLSAVRIHRSGDSAIASQAVGAQAYTTGNDIHFGAGKYQPDDPFGLHLLAHEVAHTVQQQGAAPTRQHKLEVSTPHDAAEVEADRAADAMVAGAPFAVGGGGAALIARDAEASAEGEDKPKAKPPSMKDKSVSVPILPMLGGNLGYSWAEGPSGSASFSKGVEHKFIEKKYGKEVQIVPGVVAGLSGSIAAGLGAKLDAKLMATKGKAYGPRLDDAERLTLVASGGGEVAAEAKGAIKLSAGVGVANILSATAGAELAIEAKAAIGITFSGQLDNTEDQVMGALSMIVKGEVALEGTGSITADINALGDSHNLYRYTVGKLPIGKLSIACGAMIDGDGNVKELPVVTEAEFLSPPPPSVQKRKATPEERKRLAAQHPQEGAETGASGNRAEGVPEEVEMTDEELFTSGRQQAFDSIAAHKGQVVAVFDDNTGGLACQVIVDDHHLPAAVQFSEADHRYLREHGKQVVKVTRASIVGVEMRPLYMAEVMEGCDKHVDSVAARIVGMGGVGVQLADAICTYRDTKMEPCRP